MYQGSDTCCYLKVAAGLRKRKNIRGNNAYSEFYGYGSLNKGEVRQTWK